MPRLRDFLVTAWGWANIAVSTALFGTLAILTSWIPPRGKTYLFWARNWAKSLLWLNRIPARIEVSQEAAALPQAIYMSNHESGIDILLLLLAIRQDVRFLAKRELFFVPFMGWSMWLAGFVPVDRRRTDKAKDVLSELDRRLASGISILVFPEGTRSRDGRLGRFKKSGFLTALKSGVPIVPVGVSGARAVLGARGMIIRPGPVSVRTGAPIPTAGLLVRDRPALMRRVRSEILLLSGRAEPWTVRAESEE
ncbi:MAG: lysophospholipid acyltransferase family protein [Thermoanaerobaculia bacterium]